MGPPRLCTWLQKGPLLHGKATTLIQNRQTQITCGVLQGDPLSPFLFNITLDWVLSKLFPAIDTKMHDTNIQYMAYADDIALLAATPAGMQEQLDRIPTAGRKVGLDLGPAKCVSVYIRGDRKRKMWFVDSAHHFRVGGEEIKSLEPDQSFKYLGLEVGPSPRTGEP